MAATIRLFSRAMVSGSQSAAGAGGVRTCYSATRPNMVLTKEFINVDISESGGDNGLFLLHQRFLIRVDITTLGNFFYQF